MLAIEGMNKRLREQSRRWRFILVSQQARAESMAVNAEFEAVEHVVEV
jgi:hypothetical protein